MQLELGLYCKDCDKAILVECYSPVTIGLADLAENLVDSWEMALHEHVAMFHADQLEAIYGKKMEYVR